MSANYIPRGSWLDPLTGELTRPVRRFLEAQAEELAALTPGDEGQVYSTVGGVSAFRDLVDILPVGMIRQVRHGSASLLVTSTTNTFVATGLSVSITPISSSSVIYVLVFQNGCRKDTGNTSLQLRVRRNTTVIGTLADGAGDTGSVATNHVGSIAGIVTDTPTSLSAISYNTQFCSAANVPNAHVQYNGALSSILAVEVAA